MGRSPRIALNARHPAVRTGHPNARSPPRFVNQCWVRVAAATLWSGIGRRGVCGTMHPDGEVAATLLGMSSCAGAGGHVLADRLGSPDQTRTGVTGLRGRTRTIRRTPPHLGRRRQSPEESNGSRGATAPKRFAPFPTDSRSPAAHVAELLHCTIGEVRTWCSPSSWSLVEERSSPCRTAAGVPGGGGAQSTNQSVTVSPSGLRFERWAPRRNPEAHLSLGQSLPVLDRAIGICPDPPRALEEVGVHPMRSPHLVPHRCSEGFLWSRTCRLQARRVENARCPRRLQAISSRLCSIHITERFTPTACDG